MVVQPGGAGADVLPSVALAWDNCRSAGGAADRSFACDTNAGQHVLVGSFVAPDSISLLASVESEIHLISNSPTLPDWWRLRSQTGQLGQCRDGSLVTSGDLTDLSGCADYYRGLAAGGTQSYLVGYLGPNMVRFRQLWAVHSTDAGPVTAGAEYYAFKTIIDNAKTVGADACGGCSESVCIVLHEVHLIQVAGTPGGDVRILSPIQPVVNAVTWNGPASQDMCALVPVRATTWGAIKGLYR
jgi:hypothetical protein